MKYSWKWTFLTFFDLFNFHLDMCNGQDKSCIYMFYHNLMHIHFPCFRSVKSLFHPVINKLFFFYSKIFFIQIINRPILEGSIKWLLSRRNPYHFENNSRYLRFFLIRVWLIRQPVQLATLPNVWFAKDST